MDGSWWLDIKRKDFVIVTEWNPKGFGVSRIRSCGKPKIDFRGHDNMHKDADAVFRNVRRQISQFRQ